VEDLWFTAAFQRHLQDIYRELSVRAVGELTGKNVSGEEIHNRHQEEEFSASKMWVI